MKYVIHSKSERGFYNRQLKWVKYIEKATKFSRLTRFDPMFVTPPTKNNDIEWIICEYSE